MAQSVPSQSVIPGVPADSRLFQQKFPTQAAASVPSSSGVKKFDQNTQTKGRVSGANRTVEQAAMNPASGGSQYKDNKGPSQTENSVNPAGANGHCNHSDSTSSQAKSKKRGRPKSSLRGQSIFTKGNTFWTKCARCMMKYEYMRVYHNQTLSCPNCKQGFVAYEIRPPSNIKLIPESVHNNLTSSSTAYAQATSNSQPARESGIREREEAHMTGGGSERSNHPAFVLSGDYPSKRMKETDDQLRWNFQDGTLNQAGIGNVETGVRSAYDPKIGHPEANRAKIFSVSQMKLDVKRELSSLEVRKMISEKAAVEIREKLKGWTLANEDRAASENREKVKGKMKLKSNIGKVRSMLLSRSHSDSADTKEGSQLKKISGTSADGTEPEGAGMIVPDPDFHDFDLDRSESCFGENQVWAGYDNDDGMPRFYALIHKVISLDPFKLEISWLNSKSTAEFGVVDWVGRGFSKSCGEFWIGKHETNNLLNSFSHRVKWVKGPRGVIQIYPKKGDIWALYRNWSFDWDQNTPDDIIHVYDMFEVLEDYNEELGVSVAPLVKVADFRTVFSKQPDLKEVKQIPKEEMFRFSHQVPCHILTGDEKPNAPKGYVELDPASTAPELLRLATSAKKEQGTELSSTAESKNPKINGSASEHEVVCLD